MTPSVEPRERTRMISVPPDRPLIAGLALVGGSYIVLIVALLAADATFTSFGHLANALRNEEIQFSIKLSLVTCTLTAILSVCVAIPLGYLLARYTFPLKDLVDAMIDIPIVLPPLVIGLSLLILFQTPIGRGIERVVSVTYAIPGVILAQFMIACAFAVRTMHATFSEIGARREHVALTLGCTQAQAFWQVVLPDARRGIVTAATLAWARALGEFGPILIFAGATRMRTEVLPTTVFLELSIGNIEAAVAVSLIMVLAAIAVLVAVRMLGMRSGGARA